MTTTVTIVAGQGQRCRKEEDVDSELHCGALILIFEGVYDASQGFTRRDVGFV